MGFSQENGYTPTTIEAIMQAIMNGINAQFGQDYTVETFIGTNFYKYAYAIAQRIQANEVKTSEVFLKLQQYFEVTNERIVRPKATAPGILETLEDAGYVGSVKPPEVGDAGKIFIAVDVDDGEHAEGTIEITSYSNLLSGDPDTITVGGTEFTAQSGAATPGEATFQAASSNEETAQSLADQINAHADAGALVRARVVGAVVKLRAIQGGTDGNTIALDYTDNDTNDGATVSDTTLSGGETDEEYADKRLEICTLIKNSVAAGIITQGTEVESLTLSNGQSFDFKYFVPNRVPVNLRLTIETSENNEVVISSPEEIKDLLLANIAERYRLGKNFEPQRYFSLADAPWASAVKLEYSLDEGATYDDAVYETEFDELFDVALERVSVVEV